VIKTTSLCALLLLASAVPAPVGAAERGGRGTRLAKPRTVPLDPFLVGTIKYDTGINAGYHPDSSGANQNRVVGNRFNSAVGGPLLFTGMVHTITVFPANDGLQSVSITTAPTSMGTAMVLDFQAANMMAGQFNQIPLQASVTVGPDFLALFLGSFNATQPAGLLGMADMATMGQGYHAIEGFYAFPLATMLQAVPNRNAMLRVTVDVPVPVELMDFQIQ
jgi:hypothetical protein